jgi:ubiquinone/menaquinone biosynthesis C-methylase UbiE
VICEDSVVTEVRGSRVDRPPDLTPAAFDLAHREISRHDLPWRLAAEAYGRDYPAEIEAWGMSTWWTLGRYVSELKVGPGRTFADLACGRGGPGLWVARATGADLVGVDWSPAGVAEAERRASSFVPAGRARFQVGDLEATGLATASLAGAMCADAIFFASDRVAAMGEAARVLKRGGRFVFTADESSDERPAAVPDWQPIIEAGGLILERKEQIPRFAEYLGRMYELWLANEGALRAELGDEGAIQLLDEARAVGPTLTSRRALIFTTVRP